MRNLMGKVAQKGKQLATLGGLVAIGLPFNGCQTIVDSETDYGTPVIHKEIVPGDEISNNYLISEIKNSGDQLEIGVLKQKVRLDEEISYEIVPVTYKRYEIKKRAGGTQTCWGLVGYGIYNFVGLGIPLAADIIVTLCGKPEETFFNINTMENCTNPKRIYLDKSSKKYISSTESEEKRNEQTSQVETNLENACAANVPVRIIYETQTNPGNPVELTKNANNEGEVVFEINGNPGKTTIETLAEDGENDREVLN